LQQTPCAQTPPAQSLSREHSEPICCLPHEPPAHTLGAEHSSLARQELPQRLPAQL
jgi:hypothetical protein